MSGSRRIAAVAALVIGLGAGAPARPDEAASPLLSGGRAGFPAHWWTPVSREGAPAWEILPQEAGPGEGDPVAATREKVRQNAGVRRVLLSTGDLVLRPDHHQEPNAPPEWRYFEILTRIRADLGKRERDAKGR